MTRNVIMNIIMRSEEWILKSCQRELWGFLEGNFHWMIGIDQIKNTGS